MNTEFKVSSFEFKTTDSALGAFEGYGSVFSNEDYDGDMMMPGAFTKTLADYKTRGKMPKMLLNHGGLGGFFSAPAPEDLIPVGKWISMSEDAHGLQCKGQLINLDTETGKRLYGAMKEGQLDGLSIGYRMKDFTRGAKENEPRRTIKAVDLIEVSPVTFPANTAATITAVKSGTSPRDIRFLEAVLRDAGLSRTEAKAVLAGGFKSLALRDAEADQDLVALLNRAAAAIHPSN